MRSVAFLLCLVLGAPASAPAYEEKAVRDGGVLKGRVTYAGSPPVAAFLPVLKNQDVCGERVPDTSLLVSSSGGLSNAIVELQGISSGKPIPATSGVLDNRECVFEPRVQARVVGQSLLLKNSDPILHDAHAWLGPKTIFNLGLPSWRRVAHQLDVPGLHAVDCNVLHTWMKAWIFVSEHPYVAVTDGEGSFSLTEVPPGHYRLRVWHETLGERETAVSVAPGGTTRLAVEFSPP